MTFSALRNLARWGSTAYPGVDSPPVAEWRYYLKAWLDERPKRRRLLSRNFLRSMRHEPWLQRLIRAEVRMQMFWASLVGAAVGLWLAL